MIILGIDPGTRILGYSLLEVDESTSGPKILAMDVLYLRNLPEFDRRIRHIFESTVRIIDSFHPDHLAIEAPFFGKNVMSALKLGRAQGVAIAAALSRDLSYTEYEPSVIKQYVTGNGNAGKEQVASMLQSILGFDDNPKYLDATDALAVAYTCHLHLSNPLADLREQLVVKPKRQPSRKKQWADFINSNPERVK